MLKKTVISFLFISVVSMYINFLHGMRRAVESLSEEGAKTVRPVDFINLQKEMPDLLISLRYRSSQNFLGRCVKGYDQAMPWLTKKAAAALQKAANEFRDQGFFIVLYDAFRPECAVQDFKEWAEAPEGLESLKKLYYPLFSKPQLFEQGYIASQSSHSRGSTVDITLLAINTKERFLTGEMTEHLYRLKDGRTLTLLDDGTLLMGGHFDLFDPSSHQDTPLIDEEAKKNRTLLKNVMCKHGFQPIETEWWHFTLKEEPYPDQSFDCSLKETSPV